MKKVFMSIALFLLTVVSLSVVPLKAETPIGTSFNFSIETKIGNNDPVVTDLGLKAYGSSVTIDAGSYNTGNEFVTYIVNGKVEAGLPANNAFLVTSDLEITAVYKPTGTVAVAFMDTNQDLLGASFVTSGGEVSAPDISGLSKPGLVVSATTPWSEAFNNPTEDKVVWVVYETSGTETYSLTVNNGTGSGTYDYNEVATVSYNGTGTFQYWFMDGNIVSLQPTYSFTVVDNKEITAVYTGEETGPTSEALFIALSDPYAIKTSYSTYIGQFYLPTGHEMVEFGLIASDTPGDITLATSGVEKIRSDKFNPDTGEFVRSLLDSTYASKNIRAYMITTDGSTFTETYSFVNENLFFSEYGESGSNKWIEIYNPNDYTVDLSNYSIKTFFNGSTSTNTSASLTGKTVDAKDVYVIYYASDTIFDTEGDLSNTVANFNGNDALLLYKNNFPLDQLGSVGSSAVYAEDVTLTRKSEIVTFNQVFTIGEWNSEATTFDYLGSHNLPPSSISISGDASVMVGATINLSVSYNPTNSTKGVTWSSSNETIATVDSSGVVTGVSTGTVTITATSTADTNVSDTYSVEVTAPVTYTVTYMSDGSQFVQQTGILSGTTTSAPDPAPTKTGYTFGGWFTDNNTFLNEFDFATDIVTENITLYAKWIESGTVIYGSDLFISEYIEGTPGNRKAIEIYNPTSAPIVLTGVYTLAINANANTTWSTAIALNGTIQPGDVFVIYYDDSTSNDKLGPFGDQESLSLSFNGDDAIGLFKNGILIDIFGVFGEDPGSGWTIGSTTNATVDRIIVRIPTVKDPSTIWNTSEWEIISVYTDGSVTTLGTHIYNPEE